MSHVPDLSPRARRILQQAAAADAMPPAAQRRVWDRLDAVAPGPDRRFWFSVGLTVAAAFVLVVALRTVGGALAMNLEPTAPHSAVDAATPERVLRRSVEVRGRAGTPQPAVRGNPPATRDARAPLASSARPRSTSGTPEGPSALARERATIERAWASIGRGHWTQALEHTEAHAQQFSEGALAPEREAIRAIARCKLARPEAGAQAQRYLAQTDTSALASQVRAACEKLEVDALEPPRHGHSPP